MRKCLGNIWGKLTEDQVILVESADSPQYGFLSLVRTLLFLAQHKGKITNALLLGRLEEEENPWHNEPLAQSDAYAKVACFGAAYPDP